MKLLRPIDIFLNGITMYRLTLYYLIVLVVLAVLFSIAGFLSYNPLSLIGSAVVFVTVTFAANYIFARCFHASTNTESVFITALILVLIMPFNFPQNIFYIVGLAIISMAVKYLVIVEKQHIVNPAAAAVAAMALLFPGNIATWWVGTPLLMPFVLLGGLLIVRKIRREDMVAIFLFVYGLIVLVFGFIHSETLLSALSVLERGAVESALFFFVCIMFTEPLTTPPTKRLRQYYAVVVAVLYTTPQIRLLGIAFTPEVALCLGNFFSCIIAPRYRLILTLREKINLTGDMLSLVFDKKQAFSFTPGQYMEWTLPHNHVDSRGNRRYFSLASSPTEKDPMITIKMHSPSSSYKTALSGLNRGDTIIASGLAGDFTLPKNPTTPLVFIAGGVGIAPFRSMISYIVDKKQESDIILIFSGRAEEEIVFQDLFKKAEKFGVKTIPLITNNANIPKNWKGKTGYISEKLIRETVPDFKNRVFYISGPQLMVQQVEEILRGLGVARRHIKTDFFPGYKETK